MPRHCQQWRDINADFRQHNHDGDGLIITASALRNSVSRVRVRARVAGGHEYPKPAGFRSNWRACPANRREEKNECDTDQDIYGFCPAPFCSQFQKSNNPHALTATLPPRRLSEYAPFSTPPTPAIQPFLQLRIVTLSMWRERMVFASQRENIPETNAAIPITPGCAPLHPS